MPIFEFRCSACGSKFSTLVGVVSGASDVTCPKCGAGEARKLVSRPGRFRTEDARIDEVADRLETMGDLEDGGGAPMREFMKEMGRAMDDDASADMEEMFEADMEGKLDDE